MRVVRIDPYQTKKINHDADGKPILGFEADLPILEKERKKGNGVYITG